MTKRIPLIGIDLDGVIARHSLWGFWVILRKIKEKLLKKNKVANWYYPTTFLEKKAWIIINQLRTPFIDKEKILASLATNNKAKFYLVTSRFKFLEKLTLSWLKRYHLDKYFSKVLINTKNINPLIFKIKAIKKYKMDFFLDDDLEVIEDLAKTTKAKLFWIVPPYKNPKENCLSTIKSCSNLPEALKIIFNKNSPKKPFPKLKKKND